MSTSAQRHIVIYGAGWIQNMGNAFIQIGSKYTLEQTVPDAHVRIVDGNPLPLYASLTDRVLLKAGHIPFLGILKKPQEHKRRNAELAQQKLVDLVCPDAVVLSGIWLSTKYLKAHLPSFLSLRQRKIPLVINGGGGMWYTQQECAEVRELLNEIQPYALISRDDRTYDAYMNTMDRVYRGIDVGFFVADAFPRRMPISPRTVFCFDRGPVPASLHVREQDIVAHHSPLGLRWNTLTAGRVFYSEMAEDYLDLYSCCDVVSDRVHACVAALSFGNHAHLMDQTPRACLFEAVGAENICKTSVKLSDNLLRERKKQHLSALTSVFQELGFTQGI